MLNRILIMAAILCLSIGSVAQEDSVTRQFLDEHLPNGNVETEFPKLDVKGREALLSQLRTLALSPDDWKKRSKAVSVLSKIGSAAFPIAAEFTSDSNDMRRLLGLEIIDNVKTEEVSHLLEDLFRKENDRPNLGIVIRMLVERQRIKSDMLPILTKALKWDISYTPAANAILSLGSEGEPTISSLVQTVLDNEGRTPGSYEEKSSLSGVIRALGAFGRKAERAVPGIVPLLASIDLGLRLESSKALAKIGGPASEAGLIQALDSSEMDRREVAASALKALKPYGPATIDAFLRHATDENERVRTCMCLGLREVDTDAAREALARQKAFEEALKKKESEAERSAWERLWTHEEVVACQPADANHTSSCCLDREIPIVGCNGEEFLVTIQGGRGYTAGEEWAGSACVWAKLDKGYKLLWRSGDQKDNQGCDHFDNVTRFKCGKSICLYIQGNCLGSGHLQDYYIIVFGPGHRMEEVDLEKPADWYQLKLRKGEYVAKGESLTFADECMKFSFFIWNRDDGNCCPTAGLVSGTFKFEGEPFSGKKAKIVPDTCTRTDKTDWQPVK